MEQYLPLILVSLVFLAILGVWFAQRKHADQPEQPLTAEQLRQIDLDQLADLKAQLASQPTSVLQQQIAELEAKLGL